MKHVVLIGDSIRLSYQEQVRALLRGRARFWWPEENGMHSTNLLLRFWEWIDRQQPDVLHLNAGSWDVRHLVRGGEGGNVVPLDQYEKNIRRLLQMTRQRTHARIIFATTTPILEDRLERRHALSGNPCRRATDIPEYNARAIAIAETHGATINDLYSLVMQRGAQSLICEDGVHFTAEGAAVLADAVARAIDHELHHS